MKDKLKAAAFILFAYGGIIVSMSAFGLKLREESDRKKEIEKLEKEKITLEIEALKIQTQDK